MYGPPPPVCGLMLTAREGWFGYVGMSVGNLAYSSAMVLSYHFCQSLTFSSTPYCFMVSTYSFHFASVRPPS